MDMMPRQPHARIVLAVIFTASIGGLFLAGNRGARPGASVSTAPADQRVVAQPAAINIQAPEAQVALPALGRDPFAGNQTKETKPAQPLTSAPVVSSPVLPAASTNVGSVTSSVASAVGVSVSTSAPAVGSVVKNTVSTVPKTVTNTTNPVAQPTAPTAPADPVSTVDTAVPNLVDQGAATVDEAKGPVHSSHGRKAGHYRSATPEVYQRSKEQKQPYRAAASSHSSKKWHPSARGYGAAPRSNRHGHGHAYGWKRWNSTCDPNARSHSHTSCWR